MNKETAQNLLMDYLYDEISAADKEKLEAYLSDHPEMQHELDELRQTQSLLQKMPEVEPEKKLVIADPKERSLGQWWDHTKILLPKTAWGKTALATAACLILLLVAGSIANLTIQSNQAGFSVSFGEPSQPQNTGLTEAQTEAIVQQIRQDNIAIITEYADLMNKQNKQQLQQVVEYFDRQRTNDLQLIDQALSQYQDKTDYQIEQTRQVMGKVLQTVAANDQQ